MADMFDIGMAGRKALDFFSVDVESQGATSGLGVGKNERETDVAQPHNSNPCGAFFQLID